MARTMADRLAQGRTQTFVGRDRELRSFEALLDEDAPAVVVVHGPAGIGKSTLIRQFATLATTRGAVGSTLDARDLPPRVEALELALAGLLDAETTPSQRSVVIIDGYELLATIDTAVRDELAPRLRHDCILVLSRQRPPARLG